jgi:hypothetical protein
MAIRPTQGRRRPRRRHAGKLRKRDTHIQPPFRWCCLEQLHSCAPQLSRVERESKASGPMLYEMVAESSIGCVRFPGAGLRCRGGIMQSVDDIVGGKCDKTRGTLETRAAQSINNPRLPVGIPHSSLGYPLLALSIVHRPNLTVAGRISNIVGDW